MKSDFLTPPSNMNVKKFLNCSKGLFITKGPKKGPNEAIKGPKCSKMAKRAQGDPRVSNRGEQ
jgi:hypothetical protein